MREFIRRALQKTARMNNEQLQSLLALVTEEYELLDAVLDSLSTGVFICDSFHMLVQSNKAANRLIPFDKHVSQENPIWMCIKELDIAQFIQEAMENEETINAQEFAIEEFSGLRFLSLNVLPLVRSKTVKGTIITVEDITWKKQEELRNRRLESLASLTNLAATVAHEIKNPLGSISIYVQLLRKLLIQKNETSDSPEFEYLGIIDEEIERLNQIIVDFLFAVRPLKFDFTIIDLNALIKEFSLFMSKELESSKIRLELDLCKNLTQIRGDDRFLRQMFLNLVKNSMLAMPQGGELKIKTTVVEDSVHISIFDNGIGISAELLDKIFEPYFTTRVNGTGLGLAMVYKVVKEHGGDIRVQSGEGRGTTFILNFPIFRKITKMIEYEEQKT